MSFLQSLSSPARLAPEPEQPPVDEARRRRALANMVVADLLAQHSIPSDWVHGSTLEAVSRGGRPRTFVKLVVLKGDDRLLPMVGRMQEALERELRRHDIRRADWLGGISWEFRGQRDPQFASMPPPSYWRQ